ncbi:MAG TPA: DNA repair protein RecO [Solirubrobacteraceae bacterium]|nr:DNA repair protein RecO [Solirubrobacteraceae bacterium]
MAGTFKTNAIVLRSIRYGEADRILHVYTPGHGRLSAIAKGARRARSRFGARLEPFMEVELLLRAGRSELLTVTGADTINARSGLWSAEPALSGAARAADAVGRLFETDDPHPEVYALLGNELSLLAAGLAADEGAWVANGLAFRLKLLLAAGLVPQLGSCASCGEQDHLSGFSAAAGGVVCSACEAGAFALSEEAYAFMVEALGRPLARAPQAEPRALAQAERAIRETAEHHANVRLRPVGA